jgi:type III restriction enzyme
VLRPGDAQNYFDKFDLVPSALRPDLAKGRVLVSNWHLFNPQAEDIRVGGVAIGQLGAETPEAFARARLGDLWEGERVNRCWCSTTKGIMPTGPRQFRQALP